MPGGRGTVLEISAALNSPKHSKIADAIKLALDSGEYRIEATMTNLASAVMVSDELDEFMDLWDYALTNHYVEWSY